MTTFHTPPEVNKIADAQSRAAEGGANLTDVLEGGFYPEGFDKSCGLPAWAMRDGNMIAASLTGSRKWDVPCIAAALVSATGKPSKKPS